MVEHTPTKRQNTLTMANFNNFDEAMGEFEGRFSIPDMKDIENRLKDRHHSIQVSSDVLTLFMPNIVKTFVNLFGGTDEDVRGHKAPSDSDRPYRPTGPKAPTKR
jgi:hypothetical protein